MKILFNRPVTELNEKNHSLTILVSLFPLFFRITQIKSPANHRWDSLFKLFFRNLLIVISVDILKSNPVFVVLPYILQQNSKFTPGYIVVILFILSFFECLSCLERPYYDWLSFKNLWQYDLHTTVYFSERKISVTISIE
jgi:hypothetical protein